MPAVAEQFVIKRAERSQVRLRLAFQAPSGGGKTATSLLIAAGMVEALRSRGKLPAHLDGVYIGVIDTERDSASLYSHLVGFDTLVLDPPYSPARYKAALAQMVAVGYPIIILDQITHEWYGQGGVLQMVANSKALNDWTKWNGPSQEHDGFIDAILDCPAHVIATMRSKTEYVLQENDKGKKVPVRIGMQAKQREGTEYEFTTLLDLEVGTNVATCHKDRTELFKVGEKIGRMGADWGVRLIDWVYSAKGALVEQEVMPAVRARGLCEAAVRSIERTANMGDLAIAFDAGKKSLQAFANVAGRDVIVPLLEEVVAAKDKRKLALSGEGLRVRDLDPAELSRSVDPAPAPLVDQARAIQEKIARERGPNLFDDGPPPRDHVPAGVLGMDDDLPWQDDVR
ncbi:AAA domain containing protein [uncultured Caudovirales phage]|uniref:AAA domain containing protein n=1 Tax=uncultured Caudovirales phage TaxID=2100421 RepID=A0A6J5T713_9CAUD|nr:AAA domain containing protein [uncultured Caudovirales phage]